VIEAPDKLEELEELGEKQTKRALGSAGDR